MKDFLLDTLSANKNKDALVNGKEHDDDIQKSVSPDIHSSSSGAQTRKQEFEECTNNNSNGVNAASSSVSTAGQNSINNTNDFSAAGPSNAAMPNLEDLSHSNDADDVGAKADINNLESIISVKKKKDGIFISQDKYVAEILKKFRLSKGKSTSTPIDAEKPLLKDSDGEDVDVHTYRNVVIEIAVLNILSDALPITTNGIQLTMSNLQERVDSS
nr:uncharacterized mitochondrial protein AtMg00810-like [Tanacetum cinerariifolium]